MVQIRCPHCGKTHKAPETLLGKKVRCKDCQGTFQAQALPNPTAPPSRPQPLQTAPPIYPPPTPPAASQPSAPPPPPPGGPSFGEDLAPMAAAAKDHPVVAHDSADARIASNAPLQPPQAQLPPGSQAYVAPPRRRKSSFLAVLLVAILLLTGAATAVYFFVFSAGGMPGWARAYVPEGATLMAYVNARQLRDSSLYRDLEPQFAPLMEAALSNARQAGGRQPNFSFSDISEIFVAGKPLAFVAVIRTEKDFKADGLFSGVQVETKTHAGKEYTRLPGSKSDTSAPQPPTPRRRPSAGKFSAFQGQGGDFFIAQTAERTYCMSDSERTLQAILDRLASGNHAPLESRMESLLGGVKRYSHFLAISEAGLANPAGLQADAVSVGLNLNGSLEVRVSILFATESEAQANYEKADSSLETARRQMKDADLEKLPEQARQIARSTQNLVEGISLSQSGRTMTIDFSASTEDIRALFKQIGGMMSKMLPEMME